MSTTDTREIEQTILGTLIYDNKYFTDVENELSYIDFNDANNKKLYKAICEMRDKDKPVDTSTVVDYVVENNIEFKNLEGGIGLYLTTVVDPQKIVNPDNIKFYVQELKRKNFQKKFHKLCNEFGEKSLNEPVDNWIEDFEKKYEKLKSYSSIGTSSGKKKKNYTAKFPGLVDLVERDGLTHFLTKERGELVTRDSVKLDGETFYPPEISKLPFKLPNESNVREYYETDNSVKLYNDLLDYHKSISQLPTENHYDLLTAWDFHTYLQEKFQYSPYIWLYAIPERGKSRTGRGCICVAYRGIHVESLREAYMFRAANNLNCSFFIDVMDLWKKAERSGSEDLLLTRFEKGVKVPRVEFPDKGPHNDTTYYNIFGPTIIGTNINIHPILETRALLTTMPETDKEFECEVTPEMAKPYKERLVAFRARFLDVELPQSFKPVRGRLGDITKPLVQTVLAVNPERTQNLLELIEEIENSNRVRKSDSLEAKLISILSTMRSSVTNGIIYIKEVTDNYNTLMEERYQITPHRVGWRLSALGFDKGRDRNGSYIEFNDKLIRKLEIKFGLSEINNLEKTGEKINV